MPSIPTGSRSAAACCTARASSIPSQVPVGTYTAETFLIDRGKVIAAATREVEVGKGGFERYVALAARQHGFLYGLAAVSLSLLLGWAAAMAFRGGCQRTSHPL